MQMIDRFSVNISAEYNITDIAQADAKLLFLQLWSTEGSGES
jgi:hypothetical protein